MGTEAVRNKILEYYAVNWGAVRSEIETRLANYNIDDEAKETLREALYAHEAKLYRCVVRVLFPEVERALRTMLLDDITKRIGYKELVEKLNEGKAIDDFILQGLYDLHLFNHLTRALEEEGESESDDMVFGWFQRVVGEGDRNLLMQDPVPNRHAALHGFVSYSTQQHSLNAIFLADYILGVVSKAATKESGKDSTG